MSLPSAPAVIHDRAVGFAVRGGIRQEPAPQEAVFVDRQRTAHAHIFADPCLAVGVHRQCAVHRQRGGHGKGAVHRDRGGGRDAHALNIAVLELQLRTAGNGYISVDDHRALRPYPHVDHAAVKPVVLLLQGVFKHRAVVGAVGQLDRYGAGQAARLALIHVAAPRIGHRQRAAHGDVAVIDDIAERVHGQIAVEYGSRRLAHTQRTLYRYGHLALQAARTAVFLIRRCHQLAVHIWLISSITRW